LGRLRAPLVVGVWPGVHADSCRDGVPRPHCRAARCGQIEVESPPSTWFDEDQQPDLPLTAVCTATRPTTPAVFHPPVELARCRPRGRLHLDRWIDFSAICFSMLGARQRR